MSVSTAPTHARIATTLPEGYEDSDYIASMILPGVLHTAQLVVVVTPLPIATSILCHALMDPLKSHPEVTTLKNKPFKMQSAAGGQIKVLTLTPHSHEWRGSGGSLLIASDYLQFDGAQRVAFEDLCRYFDQNITLQHV